MNGRFDPSDVTTRGLFKEVVSYLRRKKILRPGITTLEKLVVQARIEAGARMEGWVYQRLLKPQMREMDTLIAPTGYGESSKRERLMAPAPNATSRSLISHLSRISELKTLGMEDLDLSGLNANRHKVFAREARRLTSYDLRKLPPARRFTLLACQFSELLRKLNDEAVITHGQLLRHLAQRSAGRKDQALLQKKGVIHQALELLTGIGKKVLAAAIPDAEVRTAGVPGLTKQADLEKLLEACQALIAPSDANELMYLNASDSYLRQFGPKFLTHLSLRATGRGFNEWQAIQFARLLDKDRKTQFIDPPMEVVPNKWRKLMTASDGQINRRLWEISLHLHLAESLKAGDIWVEHSGDFTPLSHDLNIPSEQLQDFISGSSAWSRGARSRKCCAKCKTG